MSIVRTAVVQDNPIVFDRETTIEKVRNLVKEVASQEAELVLFPEAFVSAYPKGLDIGVVAENPPGTRLVPDFAESLQSSFEPLGNVFVGVTI